MIISVALGKSFIDVEFITAEYKFADRSFCGSFNSSIYSHESKKSALLDL